MRRFLVLPFLLALALLATGCGADAADDGAHRAAATEAPGTPAPTEAASATAEPQPVATTEPPALDPVIVGAALPPIASLVEHVGGERVEVHSLVPAGTDSHTYEPSPADARALGDAVAHFGVGLGLNDAALQLAEQTVPAGAPVVRLAEIVVPQDEVVFDHSHDGDAHTHSHGGEEHTHSHDDEVEAGANAHVWLDVRYAIGFVEAIRDTLSEVDPEGAQDYASNAEEALDRLGALDDAIASAIQTIPEADRTMVVYHDAWTYFGERYALDVVAAVQPSDFSEPSAADVRAIIDQIRAEDVPAVFGSEVFPSRVLAAIADETGASYVGDLADDDLPGEPGQPEHSYEGLMVANVRAVVDALGGDSGGLDDGALLPVGEGR